MPLLLFFVYSNSNNKRNPTPALLIPQRSDHQGLLHRGLFTAVNCQRSSPVASGFFDIASNPYFQTISRQPQLPLLEEQGEALSSLPNPPILGLTQAATLGLRSSPTGSVFPFTQKYKSDTLSSPQAPPCWWVHKDPHCRNIVLMLCPFSKNPRFRCYHLR
jgi:hypothetical protein